MKLTGIIKGSLLIAIATVLIAAAPIETTVFAKDISTNSIVKKHKHKHKHHGKKTKNTTGNNNGNNKTGSKDNSSNTGNNKTGNKEQNKGKK